MTDEGWHKNTNSQWRIDFKKVQKNIDPAYRVWEIQSHTVTNHTQMRTKSLYLAALALAGGTLAASAQSNVYSLNIVGYVNTVLKGNGAYTLVANPLAAPTNDLVSLVGNALPNKSQVVVFDSGTGVYTTASKISGSWNTNLSLPVGTGFFVKNSGTADITNTFVGDVAGGSPGTNTTALSAGYSLVGSKTPVGGLLTDSGDNTLNLGGVLANKSQIVVYDSNTGIYTTASKISGSWNTNLSLSVGQGFFIKAASATNWTQVLN